MKAVRILTINVQMFPALIRAFQGHLSIFGLLVSVLEDILPKSITKWFGEPAAQVVERARFISDAILAAPADELPDVLLFNELFNEDGREAFLEALGSTWPHVEAKFAEADLEDDAGLMIMSRKPLLAVDGDKTRREVFFDNDAGHDGLTSKGAGLVAIDGPAGPLTIVSTHLQASYESETQHKLVRWSQLDQIGDMVRATPNTESGVVVAGDLNVSGPPNPDRQADEWEELFVQWQRPFGEDFHDTWKDMAPPGAPDLWDPGYTNIDSETGERKRLDYHCLSTLTRDSRRVIAAHHVRVLHENLSDHSAVEAVYQLWYSHCQPASAVDVSSATGPSVFHWQDPPGAVTSSVTCVAVDIEQEDGYFWLFLPEPGTYSIFLSKTLEHRVHAHNNVSVPLGAGDLINVDELPGHVREGFWASNKRLEGEQIAEVGSTAGSRFPLLVAIRPAPDSKRQRRPTRGGAVIVRHRGESMATAIHLQPNDPTVLPFPADQPLGTEDVCWLKVSPEVTIGGQARDEHVDFSAQGQGLGVGVFEASGGQLGDAFVAAGATTAVPFTAEGGQARYFLVKREGVGSIDHVATYLTPVRYLRMDLPLGVYVDDETGIDRFGSDEPKFELWVDGVSVHKTQWDDANTGQHWPQLAARIKQAAAPHLRHDRALAFDSGVSGTIVDDDGLLTVATGSHWFFIPDLPADRIEQAFRESVVVKDAIRDGRYTFFCSVSRDP